MNGSARRGLRIVGALAVAACGAGGACGRNAPEPPAARPSILLVTLDTTRFDAIGPLAQGVQTPAFNALVQRGRYFRQAYATAPETLAAHSSMMTGLYPGGHGVHENGRSLAASHPRLADGLRNAGYRTAAYVSSFVLARQFGLAHGFEVYDEPAPGRVERSARESTDRAVAFLEKQPATEPLFLWVHYFDPHTPYAPPDEFRARYASAPYLGEVAAMDEQLGRLVGAFDRRATATQPTAIAVVSDHGEGLGDHGEQQHGYLLYQSTMHVPLVLAGPGVTPGASDAPVSTRRIFHTIRDWAGLDATDSLRGSTQEIVLGEAMKPFLEYGWQPQVMAIEGRQKAILAGPVEIYDVIGDPGETRNLAQGTSLPPAVSLALRDYPVPSLGVAAASALNEDERRKLASLGYVSAGAAPVVRKDAPRPADMAGLFATIDAASTMFVQERYADVIPLLRRILAADPFNLDAALRLATSYSMLGREAPAIEMFRTAARIAPRSPDVPMYLALHYARGAGWERAVPLLERVVAETPDRLTALEALAGIRERQARLADALALRQAIHRLRQPTPAELVHLGGLAMAAGETATATSAFEEARRAQGGAFAHDLELGVLYLAARRLTEARDALDRVPDRHPEYAMALFKRAQVSVLLGEADRAARIDRARRRADATTRPLIEREILFRDIRRP